MQKPEVIQRQWRGFGECRITVAPSEAVASASLAGRISGGMPRLLSRSGLGTLSFTVDPAWILEDKAQLAGPHISKFLRLHGRALAEEWQSRQNAYSEPSRIQRPTVIQVQHQVEPEPSPSTPIPGPRPHGDKGLPSWFEAYFPTRRTRG